MLYYDIVVPIQHNNKSILAIVLNIDPNHVIFPFIVKSYVATKSRESFIFRIQNDSILFVSPVRFNSSPPLTLKFPIQKRNLLSRLSGKNFDQIISVRDYRGVDVLADQINNRRSYYFSDFQFICGFHSIL
ncbi:MAG: hypothetical protein P8Z35_01115 [Ignavibacteriaceae bacterium]